MPARDAGEERGIGATARWDDRDPEVDAFVESCILSFAAWDVVVFVNRNPDLCETSTALSGLLARQPSDLMPAVRVLVEEGVLIESTSEDGTLCYILTPDSGVRSTIARFVEVSSRREYRLDLVRHVLGHLTEG